MATLFAEEMILGMLGDVMIAMGTRPEAIKMSGVIRHLGDTARVIHTGQHYDQQLWADVLHDLPGVEVQHSITVGGQSRGEQIGRATDLITKFLLQSRPRVVVVQGDTNSTLAGALAAMALDIPVVHIEAGLRSFDRSMPEETNRILVDAIASLCCAPLPQNAAQLRAEGVQQDRIVVTGNTLADAFEILSPQMQPAQSVLQDLGLSPTAQYVLCTLHRAALVDDVDRLVPILVALNRLAERVEVLLPLHPRTAATVDRSGLRHHLSRVTVVPPVTPSQFMALEAEASLILSDSGGVQEEACLMRRPLLVLRDSTERPELLDGWCRLLGAESPETEIMRAWDDAPQWSAALSTKPLPYPAESASEQIVAELRRRWLT